MSAEHKRPLYAFAILLSVCALVVGHTLHTQALVRVIAATAPAAVTVAGEVFTSTSVPVPEPAEPPATAEGPSLPAVRTEPIRTTEERRTKARTTQGRPTKGRPTKDRTAKAGPAEPRQATARQANTRPASAARAVGRPDVRPAASAQRRAAPAAGSPVAARVSQAWHRSHGPRSHAQRSDRRSPRAQQRAHRPQARGHRGRAKAHQQRGSRGQQRSHGRGRGRG